MFEIYDLSKILTDIIKVSTCPKGEGKSSRIKVEFSSEVLVYLQFILNEVYMPSYGSNEGLIVCINLPHL